MGKMLTVYEALLNRKEKVCNKLGIIEIIKEYNKSIGRINTNNALWYLSRHGYIKRIIFDFYASAFFKLSRAVDDDKSSNL